jgi:hypothetical protein
LPILLTHPLLLTVQLHRIAEHTERTVHSTFALWGMSNGWWGRLCYLCPLRLLLYATPMEYNMTLYQLLRLAVWTE